MQKISLKYGLIACLIVLGIPILSSLFLGFGPDSFGISAIIGYSSMLVAMLLVYFAMRHFRDKENEGILSFIDGMKIGGLISAMGGVAWGLYNLIFVTYIMPDFYEQYYAFESGLTIGTPDFEAGFAQYMDANGFWYTTFGGTLLMFLTVFLIGVAISIISSLILQRRETQIA